MSKGDVRDPETPTSFYSKKPFYQRKDFMVMVIGTPVGLALYAFGTWFGGHLLDIWDAPAKITRVEHRVMLIERALKIVDPVPYTGDVTNAEVLAKMGVTNNAVIIDP